MSLNKKNISLSEKISDLLTAAPKTIGSDDEHEETRAKVVECDSNDELQSEIQSSNLRKKNVNLLEHIDNRYKGKKVSKKGLFNQDNESDDDLDADESEDDDDDEEDGSVDGNDVDEESNEDSVGDDGGDDDSEEEGENDSESYEGKGMNKKKLHNSKEDDSFYDDDDDDDDDDFDELDASADYSNPLLRQRSNKWKTSSLDNDDDDDNSDEEDEEGDEDEDEEEEEKRDRNDGDEDDIDDGIQTMSKTNVHAEVERGNAVRNQLKMWENLLEMRIKMQKCLLASNALPQYDIFSQFESDKEFKDGSIDVTKKIDGLLSNLLNLQKKLINNFSETKGMLTKDKANKSNEEKTKPKNKGDPMDEEIPSDTDNEEEKNQSAKESEEESEEKDSEEETKAPSKKKMKLSDYEEEISSNHQAYVDYRNSVIQKWSDKTRVASGQINKGFNQPVMKQIEFVLNDKSKLLKRTQLKRSQYDIIGKASTTVDDNEGRHVQEYDVEIYDDDDFYHQLLKELIEYKSAGITDPIQLSKQWIQLQNMRSKMKRKIDTRATKGRRIRYDVHTKLVNYMAPITIDDRWTEQAKNELYNSLFGKIRASRSEGKSESNDKS